MNEISICLHSYVDGADVTSNIPIKVEIKLCIFYIIKSNFR